MSENNRRAQSDQRIETAIGLGTPDRVPFAPKIAEYPARAYGINLYDSMIDPRNMIPGFRSYMEDIEPDAVFIDAYYSIPTLEALQPVHLSWPGPTCGLPLDSSWQHVDGTYLEGEEYPEFLQDPTHTTLTKILPRKFKALKGLSKLYLRETYDALMFNDLAAFDDPEVKEALAALSHAGRANREFNQGLGGILACIEEAGYSTYNQGALVNPFDAFADCVRGIVQTVMDMSDYPDELDQTLTMITEINSMRLIGILKSMGAKRVFMPLHCGVDEFMSPAAYERFYWPHLKKCITAIIDNGMTPMIFCEGNYNTRLDIISDVPKGKVIYMFENVDLQKAKDTVGKVACICGSVPTALLAYGSKQQIIDETRRQIDILAPGGGFIMDASITLSNVSRENMVAWREATLQYGQY